MGKSRKKETEKNKIKASRVVKDTKNKKAVDECE
jgi:hypothetical protein